jgi:hypothetical protein
MPDKLFSGNRFSLPPFQTCRFLHEYILIEKVILDFLSKFQSYVPENIVLHYAFPADKTDAEVKSSPSKLHFLIKKQRWVWIWILTVKLCQLNLN